MRVRVIAAALTAIAVLAAPSALAAQFGSALVTTVVLPGISVTGTQDLQFGTIGSFGTRTVAPTGGGRFSIQGQAATPITIQFTQLPATLGLNLAVSAWTGLGNTSPGAGGALPFIPVAGGSSSATLSVNGRYFVWIGATLTTTGAVAGTYSAPVVITVGYN